MAKIVYLVIQHQTACPEFDNSTIYVCATRKTAEYTARRLNCIFAENVKLNEENLFCDVIDFELDYHYYDVEAIEVEENRKKINKHLEGLENGIYNKKTSKRLD